MRFLRSDEQLAFAASLRELLAKADVPTLAEEWAAGRPAALRGLWARLAELGVTGLLVPEEFGGLAASPVDSGPAADLGVLAVSAELLGAGHALLAASVEHVRNRRQFGRPIGTFQAVKHRLADALIGLELARPLVHGAAVTLEPRDIS